MSAKSIKINVNPLFRDEVIDWQKRFGLTSSPQTTWFMAHVLAQRKGLILRKNVGKRKEMLEFDFTKSL